ncbi:MAG TPA: protein kinase [Planctomycetota bacterium]|nr:protein kinase [Planctomycetota bacterium]
MQITLAELSVTGPVRKVNEDSIGSRLASSDEERRTRGSLAIVADGVAGSGRGADASRLAVATALKMFADAKPGQSPREILAEIIQASNLAIYDAGMKDRDRGRGATTFTAAIFRYNEVTVGHVGDSRAYVVQGGTIRRLTTDHSTAGTQVKLGLLSESDAMKSASRFQLTRSLGHDPFVRVDYESAVVGAGNHVILCSDGVHGSVSEGEMLETVARYAPADACKHLVALAEKRGTNDNISVLVARVDRVELVLYSRGAAYYPKNQPAGLNIESEVGKVLDDRFELTALLSEGGMAKVYRAVDRSTGETVAVKIPFMRFESDPASYTRFQREEEIGRLLHHPSILRVIPVETKSRQYLVMEYLEGRTLAQLLESKRPLPAEEATRITSRLCEAMQYVHDHEIIHRDLKPQNVMLCADGTLRIMDFGIAKAPRDRNLSIKGFTPTMGTPDYMAPEQVRGEAGTEQSDIYSLGAMLYEMVTGVTPFHGDNAYVVMNSRLSGDPVAPRTLRPEISPVLEEIILHAMEREPDKRYRTVIGLQSDLDHQDLVQLTGRAGRLQAPQAWKVQWRRFRTIVVVVGIILLVLSLTLVISRGEKAPPPAKRIGHGGHGG